MLSKIALVEPHDHSEVLYVLCELLLGRQDIELCVFTQQYIHHHAPPLIREAVGIHWFTFAEVNRVAFFQQQEVNLNDCDLIIWITVAPPYNWILKLDLVSPVILIIHNRNNWFGILENLSISTHISIAFFKDIARLSCWLLYRRQQQRMLLKKVAAVGYGSINMVREAVKKGHLPASGRALWIPFAYLKHRPSIGDSPPDAIKIVIPGTVTDNGRDYYSVATALALSLPRMRRPVNLILLGKVSPVKGLRELQQLESDRFQLTTFSKWVEQEEYAAYMRKADFLILPFLSWHKVGFVKEEWGLTGVSGAVSDMIYYGLPALCSTFHQLEPELEYWMERYSSLKEFSDLLVSWVNNQQFQKLKMAIENYSGKFQLEKAGSLLTEQLKDLVKD